MNTNASPSLSQAIIASLLAFFLLRVSAIGATTPPGTLLWEYSNTNTIPDSEELVPAISADGSVFLPNGRFLDALSPTGSLKWRISLPLPENVQFGPAIATPTVRHDGALLVWVKFSPDPAITGLRAINPADGTTLWTRPWNPVAVADTFDRSFILHPDSTNVLLRAIDRGGNTLWAVPLEPEPHGSAALAIGPEGNVYAFANHLSAFNQTGELLWTVTDPPAPSFRVLSDDGTIYVRDATRFYRVDRNGLITAGPRLDPYSIFPSGNLIGSRPVVGDPQRSLELVTFSPRGEVLWSSPEIGGLLFPIASDGTAYMSGFLSDALAVIALSESGATNWQVSTPGSSVATLGPDGTLYTKAFTLTNFSPGVALRRGRLLAYSGDAPLSRKNWPLPGHDAGNTWSAEKPFYATVLSPGISRTSIVLSATLRSRATSVTAYLQIGRASNALNTIRLQEVPGPVEAQTLQFVLTNLDAASRFYYTLLLSNRTEVTQTSLKTFETPGPAENIELTEDALRLAVLGGGRVTFKTNGTVTLTAPIPVQTDTVIDAAGLNVSIDGQNQSALFSIQNATVTLSGLNLLNARNVGMPAVADFIYFLNDAGPALGGAIFASNSNLRVQSCIFSNNIAQGGAGAIDAGSVERLPAAGFGGAIYAVGSDLTISDSDFYSCRAIGGVSASPIPITATAADAGGAVFAQDSTLEVTNSVFKGNSAPSHGSRLQVNDGLGGAILLSNTVAMIRSSRFVTNTAGSGGAIFTDSALTLEGSAFDRNSALGSPSYLGSLSSFGGAVSTISSNELVASNCAFTRNFVRGGSGGGPGNFVPAGLSEGGAIYAFPGLLSLTNCVIGLNEVVPAPYILNHPGFVGFATGGGVYCSNAVIESSTIANNQLYIQPAFVDVPRLGSNIAGICAPGGTVTLHATILSNGGTNAFGTFIDRGYNLISDDSIPATQPTTRTNVDPLLGPFQIPDGFAGFFLPLPGSPALDAGDPSSFPATDARGMKRPYGPVPDIGAIEATPAPGLGISKHGSQLLFTFAPVFSGPVTLKSSTDLAIWTPVTTSVNGEPAEIPVPTSPRVQFYRIREESQ